VQIANLKYNFSDKMIIAKQKLKNITVVYRSENIRELQRKIEEICHIHLQQFEICDEQYYKTVSKKYTRCPFGYFVIPGENKLTIYHKYIDRGYLYNSVAIDKVMTFYLVAPSKREFFMKRYKADKVYDCSKHKNEFWHELHNEIQLRKKDD
jgi:hypothetical protein